MQIKYRPEIDGLRGIAVIAVIFYHARLNFHGYSLFQGGFIVSKINKKLEDITKKLNIKYLKKEDYLCTNKEKRCRVLTEKNHKIIYDQSHYTVNGAYYLGDMIYKINWLDLNEK